MGKSLKQHTINPKAMPRTQLLGHIDLDTRQWTDGVLTLSALQVYSEPPGEVCLFVFVCMWLEHSG
jgi:dynein heavy chain 2